MRKVVSGILEAVATGVVVCVALLAVTLVAGAIHDTFVFDPDFLLLATPFCERITI